MKRRPRFVTWLCLAVLTISAISLLRFSGARTLPSDLKLSVPAWYIPLTGGVGGVAALVVLAGLWRGRRWAPTLTRWAVLSYLLWTWADRLFFAPTDFSRRSWPAAAIVSLLAFGWIWWGLSRSNVRAFFRESDL